MKFPALVNAHDHLEMNHYPRTKYRERYSNAHEWGVDVNAHLNEPPLNELRAYPLKDRLFIGGLKNLLCGALYVAHHNPPHRQLFTKDFPVAVLRRYGWAHSLHFSDDRELVTSFSQRPDSSAWFIHLAEGTDERAEGEFQQLMAKGCLHKDTIIIHGVGLHGADVEDAPNIRGLVICPTTNRFLLGKLPPVEAWIKVGGRIALGSDSRLTADGDLLDELRFARSVFSPGAVEQMCDWRTTAALLGIQTDDNANYFIAESFPQTRSEIQLIMRNGMPQIGDPDAMSEYSKVKTVACTLDGVPKRMNLELARRVAACSLKEPGLILDEIPQRQSWF